MKAKLMIYAWNHAAEYGYYFGPFPSEKAGETFVKNLEAARKWGEFQYLYLNAPVTAFTGGAIG